MASYCPLCSRPMVEHDIDTNDCPQRVERRPSDALCRRCHRRPTAPKDGPLDAALLCEDCKAYLEDRMSAPDPAPIGARLAWRAR